MKKRNKKISLKEKNRRLKQSQNDSGLDVYIDDEGVSFLFRKIKGKKGYGVEYV